MARGGGDCPRAVSRRQPLQHALHAFNELYVTSSEYEHSFLRIYRVLAEQSPYVKPLERGKREPTAFPVLIVFRFLQRRTGRWKGFRTYVRLCLAPRRLQFCSLL